MIFVSILAPVILAKLKNNKIVRIVKLIILGGGGGQMIRIINKRV